MQKIIKIFLLVFIAFGLVACNKSDKNKDYYKMLDDAKNEYIESKSVNVFMKVVTSDVTTTSELIYNFDDTSIINLYHTLVDDKENYSAYVKDGEAFVSINTVKSKGSLFKMESTEVMKNYSFEGVTAAVFETFDKTLVNALVVSKDSKGVAELTWDVDKYLFIEDGLSEDKLDEAMLRYANIKENIKEIKVTFTYADDKITKIESTWVNKDNKTSNINLELRGTSEQNIDYPTDLNDYPQR